MIHKNIQLSTSNERKIAEFKRFGLSFSVIKGKDLKEVDGSIDDVILYKAIDAGEQILVEDTVLTINNKEVVDIRWKLNELAELENPQIFWITSLGIVEDGMVYIYRKSIQCKLIDNANNLIVPDDAFGFDPYLKPITENNDMDMTFYELEKEGLKDNFSPRKMAVHDLNHGFYFAKVKLSQISKWTGKYQNS